MAKLIQISINNDTSNPIMVEVSVNAEKECGLWSWEIDRIKSVELQLSNGAAGVDITHNILSDKFAVAAIEKQINDEQDQIVDALNSEDDNAAIDQMLERRAV